MTPQEQAVIEKLDVDLPQTKTIKKIYENQKIMIEGLNNEREFNKSEFEKGTEKFKDVFIELNHAKAERKHLREEMSEMKNQISDGFNHIKEAIKSKENEELKAEIRTLKTDKDKKEERRFTLQNGLILMFATIVLTTVFTNIKHIGYDSTESSAIH